MFNSIKQFYVIIPMFANLMNSCQSTELYSYREILEKFNDSDEDESDYGSDD